MAARNAEKSWMKESRDLIAKNSRSLLILMGGPGQPGLAEGGTTRQNRYEVQVEELPSIQSGNRWLTTIIRDEHPEAKDFSRVEPKAYHIAVVVIVRLRQ